MQSSLKSKAINSGIWNAFERLGTGGLLFLSNLVLARLLTPDDFGSVGLILVFVELSNSIVDGGFCASLIQKRDTTTIDYSTIFYWNILLSILLYALLFSCAPLISNFFKIEKLSLILRVQGLSLLFNAFSLVQITILKKQLEFKKLAKRNLLAIFVGTGLGILFAFQGFGVWSLVIKFLATSIFTGIIFWYKAKWYPTLTFKFSALKSLFKYGSFMLLSSLLDSLYSNSVSIVLGKGFSSKTLGYFTQARKLEDVPRQVISSILYNVSFPVFSKISNDQNTLRDAIIKSLNLLCFITFPLSILFMVIAKPLILLLFSEKWLQSVPYLQLLCLYSLMIAVVDFEQQILKATGKSNLLFYTGVTRKAVGILLILFGLYWGVYGVIGGFVISEYTGFFIIACPIRKLVSLDTLFQVKIMSKYIITASISGVIVYSLSTHIYDSFSELLQIFLSSICYILTYIIISAFLNLEGFKIVKDIIKLKNNHGTNYK